MEKIPGKIGILYGGNSSERTVSVRSGLSVYRSLKSQGIDVYLFDTGRKCLSELEKSGFERVFIVLHGKNGEDGAIQGALELMKIPYTGSGILASSLAMNKVMAKKIWQQSSLPTPSFEMITKCNDLSVAIKNFGFPFLVKPLRAGSTFGISKVNSDLNLVMAYKKAIKYDSYVFAERFIDGRELTVTVFGKNSGFLDVFPIVEIVHKGDIYTYENKYSSHEKYYQCPANLSVEIGKIVIEISEKAYRTLGCSGLARIDLILDKLNQVWLLEINTSPGMTEYSLAPLAASHIGVNYNELCLMILNQASCK